MAALNNLFSYSPFPTSSNIADMPGVAGSGGAVVTLVLSCCCKGGKNRSITERECAAPRRTRQLQCQILPQVSTGPAFSRIPAQDEVSGEN